MSTNDRLVIGGALLLLAGAAWLAPGLALLLLGAMLMAVGLVRTKQDPGGGGEQKSRAFP